MRNEDIKTIRKAMHLLKKWKLFFEAPEWSAEEEKDAYSILTIIAVLNVYSDRIGGEMCAYSEDGDPALVHFINPLPFIEQIEKELIKIELRGANRLRWGK